MHDEEFESLALKVLANEASAEETAALEGVIREDSTRQTELEEMRTVLAIVRAGAPMASALEAEKAELPAYRKGELSSAVRTHFQRQPTAERSQSWLGSFGWRMAFGSGLAVVCVVVFLSMPGPSEIQVGFYAEPVTRGSSFTSMAVTTSQVRVNAFENDKEFERWLAQPFGKNEKARIWLDEEHDLFHARLRPTLLHGSTEFTRPLPENPAQRQATFDSLVKELQTAR